MDIFMKWGRNMLLHVCLGNAVEKFCFPLDDFLVMGSLYCLMFMFWSNSLMLYPFLNKIHHIPLFMMKNGEFQCMMTGVS